ncbi:hypothetical protein [Streptosporangium sp. NBC_01469]|uniref:hypothetical protein n=1 Tax=Streptosporangium sp. NBC_01469 TaxID=2903898 RepID=UPI002E2D5D80|nr:hypothetical protein [Streptosporangium sp. NBC_01469]
MKKNPRATSPRTLAPAPPDTKPVVRPRAPLTGATGADGADGATGADDRTNGVPPAAPDWVKSKRDLPAPSAASQDVPRDATPALSLASMLWDLAQALEEGRLVPLKEAFPGQSERFREPPDLGSDGYQLRLMESERYYAMLDVAGALPAVLADRPLDIPSVAKFMKSATSVEDAQMIAAVLEKAAAGAPARREAAIAGAQREGELTLAERRGLLTDLLGGGLPVSEAAHAARVRILQDTPLDPEFEKVDDPLRAQARAALVAEFSGVTRRWPGMPAEERAGVLNKAVRLHCERLGILGRLPRIVLGEGSVDVGDGERSVTDLAAFVDARLTIEMNTRTPMWESFPLVVEALVHENTHNYQGWLIGELRAGRLDPADPRYLQAELFAVNIGRGYVRTRPGGGDHLAYLNQPLERQAIKAGLEARYAFTAALQQEGRALFEVALAASPRPPEAMLRRFGAALGGEVAAPMVTAMDLTARYLAAKNPVERFKVEILQWLDERPGFTDQELAPVRALLDSDHREGPLRRMFDTQAHGAESGAFQRLRLAAERQDGLAGDAAKAARAAAEDAATAVARARDLGQRVMDEAVQSAVAAARAQAASATELADGAEQAAALAATAAARRIITHAEAAANEAEAADASAEAQLFRDAAVAAARAAHAYADLAHGSIAYLAATTRAAGAARAEVLAQSQAEAVRAAARGANAKSEDPR